MSKSRDDAMRQTHDHIVRVGELLAQCTNELTLRAVNHDRSKFSVEEFDVFAIETANLKKVTYGSPEYDVVRARMKPALDHHYAKNAHHPECHPNGIHDMTLLDLVELLCDWKAATERHDDGDLIKSIMDNRERYGYSNSLAGTLLKTAISLHMLDGHVARAWEAIETLRKEDIVP